MGSAHNGPSARAQNFVRAQKAFCAKEIQEILENTGYLTGFSSSAAAGILGVMSEGSKHVEGGSSEDIGLEEEEENGTSTGISIMQEEEEESEATSVSSGNSSPPTPSANGYPGPWSKEPRTPLGELVDDGGEPGQDKLSSSQAPSPEWHECPECGRGFGTSRALKVHRSYHVGRKRPHSGSSSKPLLPLIMPSSPDSREGQTAPASGRGRAFHYMCAECGLGFASPATLEGHRCEHGWRRSPPAPSSHAKVSPSPNPRETNGDQDTEGADGPYHCTECSGEFGLVSELHEHYMLHARGEL